MGLDTGRKLGPYEIVSPLGAGGMGEVYRARDTKLNRDVALKVLPETLARDPERMARFKREAQVLASLNHPNIATIYGFEESDGVRALAMELVEGQTLGELLETGKSKLESGKAKLENGNSKLETRKSATTCPASFEFQVSSFEGLPIARQIAEGLEYAHERGIIHRDLKPANIKITPEGTVKILDFGLAKALDPAVAAASSPPSAGGQRPPLQDSPTLSVAATQAGVILGTAAYMSPEQARGKQVDRRADIWAFGCVLYEMLGGRKPFEGETVTDVLASVVKTEPDWEALPTDTPARIRELIRRCLTKDPKQRLRDIGEARIAIEETISGVGERSALPREGEALPYGTGGETPPLRRALPWALAGLAMIGLVVTLYAYWKASHSAPATPVELSLAVPDTQQLFTADGPAVIMSPDGSRIAYVTGATSSQSQIYVRELDRSQATPLEGAIGSSPFFSPDGQWIGFYGGNGKLEKVSVFGGAPVTLANADSHRGASWDNDGTIVFAPAVTTPLYRVPATGGTPVELTHLDAARNEITHRWPQFLPGGKEVIFTASSDNNDFENAAVESVSLSTGRTKVLVENAYFGRYVSSGFLTYISGGTLFAVPFDPSSLKATGTAMPILQDIQADLTNGSAQFSFSHTGTAVYTTGQGTGSLETVALVNRRGEATPLIKEPGHYYWPRFSPDGKRLALARDSNVYVYDLVRATLTRMTFSQPGCTAPVWTPDGKRIACSRLGTTDSGAGISWLPADGSGGMQALTQKSKLSQFPFSWSPNGRTLAFAQYSAKTGICCELWTLPVSAGGQPAKPEPFLRTQSNQGYFAPAFSPDGRWLAFYEYVSGVPQVFVVPYPGPGGKWQVSASSGVFPVWSGTGHELYYVSNETVGGLYEVPYSVQGNSFQPGRPTLLFRGGFEIRAPFGFYDAAPDGKHFAMLEPASGKAAAPAPPTVVLNWFTHVRQMVAAGRK